MSGAMSGWHIEEQGPLFGLVQSVAGTDIVYASLRSDSVVGQGMLVALRTLVADAATGAILHARLPNLTDEEAVGIAAAVAAAAAVGVEADPPKEET